jgi:acyl transferase domain-containing protein
VGLVSIHGTGTPLGDPIEVGALGQGFGAASARADGPMALLSNKSCYGHTEGTAGTSTSIFLTLHQGSKI